MRGLDVVVAGSEKLLLLFQIQVVVDAFVLFKVLLL